MKIDKNIPLPKAGTGARKRQLMRLEVNDSFQLDQKRFKNAESASNSYYNVAKRLGIKISIRTMPDGTMRLWRVK